MAAGTGLELVVENTALLHHVGEFLAGTGTGAWAMLGLVPQAWRRRRYYRMLMIAFCLESRMMQLEWQLAQVRRRYEALDAWWDDDRVEGLENYFYPVPGRRPVQRRGVPLRMEAAQWARDVRTSVRVGLRRNGDPYPPVDWESMNR